MPDTHDERGMAGARALLASSSKRTRFGRVFVEHLLAEHDDLRKQLAAATEQAGLAEAQATDIQAERNEWQRRAQRGHAVAEILRAELAAATARAEEAEAALRAEREPKPRKPVNIGTGMPATTHLEAFGQCLRNAFGAMPYHVGSSIHGKTWRDVDVRIMLDDDRFDALFPGYSDYRQRDAWWSLVCAAISELGRQRTGLPIDFQVQSMTDANEKYHGTRNPLFLIHAKDEHQPTMLPNVAQAARDEGEA